MQSKIKRLEKQVSELGTATVDMLTEVAAGHILLVERCKEQQDQLNALRDDVKMLLERSGLVSTMFLVPRE